MRKTVILALLACHLAFITSCSKDDEVYPNIITEMADLYTNEKGSFKQITLDDNKAYVISNPQTGYQKNARYRVLCGFVPEGGSATLYQLTGAYLLRDSASMAKHDPADLVSAWRTRRYINLHMASKTQGGLQYWGFVTDSIVTTTANGITSSHAYLSLHHNQNADPTSYTNDVYASIPIDSIKDITGDSPITMTIQTFNGKKVVEL